jgi:hypothetical protein
MWRVVALVALLWPSHLSGLLDGAPLDRPAEALLLGVLVPTLLWLHSSFLRRASVRGAILAILLIKFAAAFTAQQHGWCLTFEPPRPMVRDSTGKPHSWDIRADWLSDDPRCSAIMTRGYRDSFELPVWFFNLPPPDDAVTRNGFHPGEIPIRAGATGYLTVRRSGTLDLFSTAPMELSLRVDNVAVAAVRPGHHQITLPPGSHAIQFDGTMLGKEWRIVPEWDGAPMGSMLFPLATVRPPSRLDRLAHPASSWLLTAVIAALVGAWSYSAVAVMRAPELLILSGAASLAMIVAGVYVPEQPWYAAAAALLAFLVPVRRRFMNARGMCYLLIVPWLVHVATVNAHRIGRWTLYGVGNDDFQFQRFAYRIFMQQYWLEGGQITFWNQPLFRWIAGALHMVFGDSSVGQAFWDAAGVAFIMLFAYRVVSPLAGFTWGLVAALLPMLMFVLGPAATFVGFGLSEISSAGFIYLAALLAIRRRGRRDLILAGILVALGFYARLNNLPMAIAVAAFALPLTLPAGAWWRVRAWLPMVQWRLVISVATALAMASLLLAWRTWYYTGVFSMLHGTQRDYLAVWKPGMTLSEAAAAMTSSLLMVLTGHDPARLALDSVPMIAAAAISLAAVAGIRGFREAPLPAVAMFLAGLAGALVTRGWAYEGRFSIHLYGAASVLCVWALAALYNWRAKQEAA